MSFPTIPLAADESDEELHFPNTLAESLDQTIYALQRMKRASAEHPGLLYLVAPDLHELYLVAIPAARKVEEGV